MNDAKEKLINELASMKTILTEKDNEIEWYEEKNQGYQTSFFSFSLKQECERIQFNCEKEIVETRQQVKEIIVSLNSID